jgi:hypothetical protein
MKLIGWTFGQKQSINFFKYNFFPNDHNTLITVHNCWNADIAIYLERLVVATGNSSNFYISCSLINMTKNWTSVGASVGSLHRCLMHAVPFISRQFRR